MLVLKIQTFPYSGLKESNMSSSVRSTTGHTTYWKLVSVSIYPVAIQLVFWSWFSSLPIFAYEDAIIVPSIAARKIPIDMGIIYKGTR